jgi:hypothetical protein
VSATVTVTEYTVTALPEGDWPDSPRHWSVFVRPTFVKDMWVVTDMFSTPYTKNAKRVSDSLPRNFRSKHYMPLEQALEVAKKVAETMTINGMTAEDYVKRVSA